MNKIKKGLIYTGLIGTLVNSCVKENFSSYPQEPIIEENKLIYDNVKTLSILDLNKIYSMNDKIMEFNSPVDFKQGDIIVGGISEKTPGGILKKISNISIDKKTISTTNANLEEVIKDGEIKINKRLNAKDIGTKTDLKSSNEYSFHYPIEKKVIFDLDKRLVTTHDQITLEGDIYFDIDYDLYSKFKDGIKQFDFKTRIKQKADLNFVGDLSLYVDSEVNLYSQSFIPLFIPTPLAIPLVLRPELKITAGIEGKINGKIDSKIEEECIIEGEINYENGSWKTSNNLERKVQGELTGVDADMNLIGYVSPKVNLKINEILGPYVDTKGYLEIDVDNRMTPWWKLLGGVKFSMGVDMGLFSSFIPNYDKKIIDYRALICKSEGKKEVTEFFDNFEGNCEYLFPHRWIPDANSSDYMSSIIKENDNKVLRLYGKVGSCWGALAYLPREIDAPYDLSVKIKNGSEEIYGCHPSRGSVGLRNGNSWTEPAHNLFYFEKNGDMINLKGEKITNLPLDKWHKIDLKMKKNKEDCIVEYYVDEKLINTESSPINKLNYKNLELSVNEGFAYFDDFKIIKR